MWGGKKGPHTSKPQPAMWSSGAAKETVVYQRYQGGEALRFIAATYQGDPGAAAPVRPADVEAQEGGGHDEAEHRDKHHPALHYG